MQALDRNNYSILVVDDMAAGRYAMARCLREAGFRTVEAAAGARALELAPYVSAMVLDIHLPDLHGLEVCRLVRKGPGTRSLPIVHTSAVYVTEADRDASIASGADRYFTAPIDPSLLASTLDELLAASAGRF